MISALFTQHKNSSYLLKALFILFLWLTNPMTTLADTISDNSTNDPIMIFVSLSMPVQSLKQWLYQAHYANASVLIRGLAENSFKKTAMQIAFLVKQTGGGLAIDPQAFERFHITQVPAVVSYDTKSGEYDVVYGDISLDYALRLLIEQGSIPNERAKQALASLTTHA